MSSIKLTLYNVSRRRKKSCPMSTVRLLPRTHAQTFPTLFMYTQSQCPFPVCCHQKFARLLFMSPDHLLENIRRFNLIEKQKITSSLFRTSRSSTPPLSFVSASSRSPVLMFLACGKLERHLCSIMDHPIPERKDIVSSCLQPSCAFLPTFLHVYQSDPLFPPTEHQTESSN